MTLNINSLTIKTALAALFISFLMPAAAQDVAAGQQIWDANCVACHAINDKVVGPALKDVTKRRSQDWLIKWIRNSQAMIKSGDPIAVQLAQEYNGQVMNAYENLSDDEIKSVLAYIDQESSAPAAAAAAASAGAPVAAGTAAPADTKLTGQMNLLLIIISVVALLIALLIFQILGLMYRYAGVQFTSWNKINAWLMLVFLGAGLIGALWEFGAHGKHILIKNAASEHGAAIDSMMVTTLIITGFVFFVTQIVLFWFAFRYQKREGQKAYYYPHNNTLEYVWTIIPAIALTVLVINGFNKWHRITSKAPENAHEIEIFAYQFGWNARYPGKDGQLGFANFNLITSSNPLGVYTSETYNNALNAARADLNEYDSIRNLMTNIPDPTKDEKDKMSELDMRLGLKTSLVSRLQALDAKSDQLVAGDDDVITNEIHVPLGEPVLLRFRARDVIHSAYMPHFRLQMNCVPGMPTQFWFVPTKTTAEMRNILNNPKFDYHLICAKICGSAHFNMKIKVIVESKADYDKWLRGQKPALKKSEPAAPANEEPTLTAQLIK